MMSNFPSVTHILFDLDGLLLDTEGIYKECIDKALEKYGKKYTDDVRIKVVGTKEQDTCRIIVEELKLPTSSTEFADELFEYYKSSLGRAEIKPGAEKLIKHFHKKGIPMAVATSSGKETCNIKLERYTDLCSYFNHIVMGSSDIEVVHGKPSPDIFFVAAKRFPDSPAPDKCLVFEDSYNGVLAAKAAMMQVVMVPEELVSEEKQKEATLVLRSLEEFKPEIFGLPELNS